MNISYANSEHLEVLCKFFTSSSSEKFIKANHLETTDLDDQTKDLRKICKKMEIHKKLLILRQQLIKNYKKAELKNKNMSAQEGIQMEQELQKRLQSSCSVSAREAKRMIETGHSKAKFIFHQMVEERAGVVKLKKEIVQLEKELSKYN